jgi:alcohol/geraniol dehydrogenase (NADP+)
MTKAWAAVLNPIPVVVFPMIMGQNSVSGSPNGAPITSQKMLEFCVRDAIAPRPSIFPWRR